MKNYTVSEEEIITTAKKLCAARNEATVKDIQGVFSGYPRCNQYKNYDRVILEAGIHGQRIAQVLRSSQEFTCKKLRGKRRSVWMMISEKEMSA
jgi:hypothetical protein